MKYEEVYLNEYASVRDCRDSLAKYFEFYNCERRHQGLDLWTPQKGYHSGV